MNELYAYIDAIAQTVAGATGISTLREFPRPDQKLGLPSISLTTKSARISPRMAQTGASVLVSPAQEGQAELREIMTTVGQYEISMAMDIWTEYKAGREEIYSKIMEMLDTGTNSFTVPLPLYHGVGCQCEYLGFRYLDSPAMAGQGEWRMNLDWMVNFERVRVEQQTIIEEVDVDSEVD